MALIGSGRALITQPTEFLVDAAARYGVVFRVSALGQTMTVLAGAEGPELMTRPGALDRRGLFQTFASEVGLDVFGVVGEAHRSLRSLMRLGNPQWLVCSTAICHDQGQVFLRQDRIQLESTNEK